MGKIRTNDPRYDMLRTIPQKQGKQCMICNQSCFISKVIKNENVFLSYHENHPLHPEGEISIHYYYSSMGRNDRYILGNKFPPCFVSVDYRATTKKWIKYIPEK